MLVWVIKKLFSGLIGKVPPKKRGQYAARLGRLLADLTRAAAEGAVQGVKGG